ncbi:MAG: carboxyltransferase domain-containing protein [Pseudomonadota bacterium]
MSNVELLPLGPDGVLVRFADALSDPANRAALAFRAHIDAAEISGVVETATSLTSVFVRFRPDTTRRAVLEEALRGLLEGRDWAHAALPDGRKRWHIPAFFEGAAAPDLDAVAAQIGCDPDAAIVELCATPVRVLALGFAPGQPYLGFLPAAWNIPRRTEVTPEVPRGAVVVAVRQVIPFANPAPTGWWQIGQTAFRCYDPTAEPALPLRAGDEVQFQEVTATEWTRLQAAKRGGAEAEVLP